MGVVESYLIKNLQAYVSGSQEGKGPPPPAHKVCFSVRKYNQQNEIFKRN